MKKMIVLMLALVLTLSSMLVVSACADTGYGDWPTRDNYGVGTALKNLKSEKDRHQSYFGPNRNYAGAGAYKPYKVISATALFREGDFVLVDLDYKTVGRRCVYFKASSLVNASVESVNLTPYRAVTTAAVQPTFGPGYQYDGVEQTVINPKTGAQVTKRIELGRGSLVNVFFETDGWVFAEFGCALGTICGWIPAGMVTPN